MGPLVSVIVPVYNVEKYLDRCIKSIVEQTHKNLEIILIDDGSPDNCPNICEVWGERDSRIKVIHKENGGLADARNYGINIANGEYIAFIDSDDYIHNQFIEILLNMCIKNKSMLSICGFKRTSDKEISEKKINIETYKLNNYEALLRKDDIWEVAGVVAWNKLYHKSLWKDIRFPKGKIHEDEATTYKLLYECENIIVTDEELYFYFVGNTSICRSKFSLKRMDSLEALLGKYNWFKEKNEKQLMEKSLVDYIDRLMSWYAICEEMDSGVIEFRSELKECFNKFYKEVILNKEIKINKRIKYFIFKKFTNIFVYIFNNKVDIKAKSSIFTKYFNTIKE